MATHTKEDMDVQNKHVEEEEFLLRRCGYRGLLPVHLLLGPFIIVSHMASMHVARRV